ncbi:hypothetical protein ACFW7K_00310 [Streptomyces sp. NPDC058735]|uniref:hypothetical protein n=1 Tax=unclassified Streptomyces TaxID=2593676 RepID=UPI003680BA0A
MSDVRPGTPMTTALALPATARAVSAQRRRAVHWTASGASATVVGLVFGPGGDGTAWLRALAGFCVVCGPAAAAVGAAAFVTARRMRRAVATHPWTACGAVAVPSGRGAPRVVLRHPRAGTLIPLAVRTMAPRHHLADPGPDGVLWWAGDPGSGGVVAPPGGEHLLWVRPTPSRRLRRRDAEAAVRQGLLSGPTPPQAGMAGVPECPGPKAGKGG